jgi:hypothetical protein
MTNVPTGRPYGSSRERSLLHLSAKADAGNDIGGVVCFCLIGLLLTLTVMLRFPDLGALIQQYNLF